MSRPLRAAMKPPTPTVVFDSYWTFATRRQEIFHQRVEGAPPPWTDDPVLREFRFTNAYRAADRVSQYLIRHVAYQGDQSAEEVVFRVLLFKLFNRISTWELLESEIGEITAAGFDVERYDSVMTKAIGNGQRLYSAAYIMPPASRGGGRKHSSHLQLIQAMLEDRLPDQLLGSASMADAFGLLLGLRGVGTFLAYQLVTDINYTAALDYSEMEFVMAGPGARSGIEKCFSDLGDYSVEDVIRWTADRQLDEVRKRGLDFMDLWGRPLQLIDCQNLFCEVDKYARVVHPEVASRAGRTRIKQRFQADPSPLEVWFPPKWGLNEHVPDAPFVPATTELGRSERFSPSSAHASCGQAELFCSEPDTSALS
ncbi:nucleotide kinase domain-containing protein [Candidatus Poriferisodalis sp.]|uniref:nucleotide kinase domain-containing protein n=1 Tax=Candidatus Poriferisodalis sp. TaxID=3101277 RepID=UPI003B020480